MKTDVRTRYVSLNSSWNENVSDKRCRQNQNIQFMFRNSFSKNHAAYEIM
jgi:hypothetical protein